jgi:hypothetical protein
MLYETYLEAAALPPAMIRPLLTSIPSLLCVVLIQTYIYTHSDATDNKTRQPMLLSQFFVSPLAPNIHLLQSLYLEPLPPTSLPPRPSHGCPSMPVLDTFSSSTEPALTQLAQQPCQSGTAVNRAALNATTASRYPRAHSIPISLSTTIHRCISNHPSASAHRQNPRLAV